MLLFLRLLGIGFAGFLSTILFGAHTVLTGAARVVCGAFILLLSPIGGLAFVIWFLGRIANGASYEEAAEELRARHESANVRRRFATLERAVKEATLSCH